MVTDASLAQRRAARPDASSWVSANAGSGKTRVLTDRVARLLLGGADPGRILCLTYTTAAAAEMQTRLFRTLGQWAMMPDADLRAAIEALGEAEAAQDEAALDRARTLFARALETPGGLKIQTIHAFCDGLLRHFPLEAGVPPQFTVLDDRQARALRAETLDAVALAEGGAFAGIAAIGPEDLDPLLQEIARHRAAFEGPGDPEALARALGVEEAVAFALSAADRRLLAEAAALGAASGPKDAGTAAKLRAALAGPAGEIQEALEGALLYGPTAKAPFGPKTDFPAKALRKAHAGLCDGLDALAAAVAEARPGRIARAAWEKACALQAFGRVWLAAYGARKTRAGMLDFDDLIDRAGALLQDRGVGAWVLWRLDGGVDHVLVDEAQDTSPAQWSVIAAITDEFFAGAGGRTIERTVFVVGDEKQSIYSFQGADPAAFGDMRDRFARMLEAMDRELARCDLLWSFRSAGPILALVDAVFAGPAGAGLEGARHLAFDPEAPGRVELWPFLEKPEKAEEGPWHLPEEADVAADPAEDLADRIACEIRGWLDAGRILPGVAPPRAVRAGDVLILVQRRGAIFDATIRALKRRGVPVAGADLLRIGAELAVRDLLAALKAVALTADDLSLAAALRSPLGDVSERGLFDLAHDRRGTLWQALAAAEPAPALREVLRDLRAQADFLRPYDLLQRLLIRHDGRRRLVARLGAEAEDGVDALLEQALAYESVEPPTLLGFLDWIERDEVKVKRRMEGALDQVRVMTVHGAKGLEAPIVILPDTAERREGGRPPQILRAGDAAFWRAAAAEAPALLAEAEAERAARASAENRRLLYVALTRARSWLIVAGAGKAGPESWHGLTAAALATLGPVEEPREEGAVVALSHRWAEAAGAERPAGAAAVEVPDWLRQRPGPAEAEATLSPSGLGGAHALAGEGMEGAEAQAWGSALHLALERLPDLPRADWERAAARLLPEALAAEVLAEAAAVLEAEGLAAVFGPGALAEVDVAGALPALGGRRIAGRIDRLLVGPEAVTAVDFKSNRVVPDRPEAAPEAILRQMGAYAAALVPLWPGRRIETAVLWTRARRLMVLPPALTAAALARAEAELAAGALLDPGEGRS